LLDLIRNRIDILINNAGALWWKKVIDTPMKRYDLINGVNSRGSFACTQAVLPHMLKQKHGQIIVMSPPIDLNFLPGKVAYSISKFGMTLLAHGLAEELKGTGVAINALWPATMIESYATINFKLGDTSLWRKASIIAECSLAIVNSDPDKLNGKALIDEDFMKSIGITDFTSYRCDPNVEPPRITNEYADVGLVKDVKDIPSKL
jgi:citronellol/citronellal dehydrogenase